MLCAEGFPRHPSLDRPTLGQPSRSRLIWIKRLLRCRSIPPCGRERIFCWKIANRKGRSDVEAFWASSGFFLDGDKSSDRPNSKNSDRPQDLARPCHVAPTGSSFLGWQQSCSAYTRVFDRQNSTLFECQGTANVKWDRNKAITHNAVTAVCTPVLPAFPNASGDYDLGPVVGTSTETSSLRGLLWFVASQQDKKVAFCYKGLFGGGPVPSLTISSCGSTALP